MANAQQVGLEGVLVSRLWLAASLDDPFIEPFKLALSCDETFPLSSDQGRFAF